MRGDGGIVHLGLKRRSVYKGLREGTRAEHCKLSRGTVILTKLVIITISGHTIYNII